MEVSFSSEAICSSARLRSRRTACASSWLLQKSGCATRASSDFRRSRYCGASKITPDECTAGFEAFVTVLEVFEDHIVSGARSAALAGRWTAFLKVIANRITETSTQSQANQSPNRV